MTDETQNSAQAENQHKTPSGESFEGLLDHHEYHFSQQWKHNPARKEILTYVARLERLQVTPDIIALVRKLQASRGAYLEDAAFLTANEQYRVMAEIAQALGTLIDGWKGETE